MGFLAQKMKKTNQLHDFISIKNALFSEVHLGISANTILLLFHIFIFLLQQRLKSNDLIIGVLTLIHLGMLIILGCTGTNVFVFQDFWSDIRCKSFTYLYRFLRVFSICATCLLSVVQAITLSPRSSCLESLKIVPTSEPVSLMFLWIFYMVFSAHFSYSSTAILNVTSSSIMYNTKLCMILSMSYFQRHLFSVLGVFWDVFLIGLMALSSGYKLVVLLCRHKRYFQHLQSTNLSPKASPVQRATWTILLFMNSFVFMYCFDCIFSSSRIMWNNDPICHYIQMIVANEYATTCPLLIIFTEKQIINFLKCFLGKIAHI